MTEMMAEGADAPDLCCECDDSLPSSGWAFRERAHSDNSVVLGRLCVSCGLRFFGLDNDPYLADVTPGEIEF